MTLDTHLNALSEKHHKLEEAILSEEQRPYPDQIKITELKREKLRIKDQLERFRSTH